MSADDAEAHRTALLEAITEATGGRERVTVDVGELGRRLGLTDQDTRAAHRWLRAEGFVEDQALGMKRVSLSRKGIERHDEATKRPNEPTDGMVPVSSITYNTTFTGPVTNVQQAGPGSTQQAAATISAAPDSTPWWKHFWVQFGAAALATVVAFFVIRALVTDDNGGDDSPVDGSAEDAATDEPEAPFVACAEGLCIPLTITNTVEGGRDVGVYVLSSPYGEGERLTGVFSNTTIYAMCFVADGLEAVPGERRWVKSSFDFVAGDVAVDGSFANPPGSRPSRTSSDYGYVTADSVGPDDLFARLPECAE